MWDVGGGCRVWEEVARCRNGRDRENMEKALDRESLDGNVGDDT
jgi:hypothetical protein